MIRLLDAHLVAVRVAGIVEPGSFVQSDGVYHERVVILPVTNGVSVPSGFWVLGQFPAIGPDGAPHALIFIHDEDLIGSLHDLKRPQFEEQIAWKAGRVAAIERIVDEREGYLSGPIARLVGISHLFAPLGEGSVAFHAGGLDSRSESIPDSANVATRRRAGRSWGLFGCDAGAIPERWGRGILLLRSRLLCSSCGAERGAQAQHGRRGQHRNQRSL